MNLNVCTPATKMNCPYGCGYQFNLWIIVLTTGEIHIYSSDTELSIHYRTCPQNPQRDLVI